MYGPTLMDRLPSRIAEVERKQIPLPNIEKDSPK